MYAKIFNQIFDSSIAETPEVRFTFMDLLVLADVNGVVDMTHEAIARRTNRPIEVIRSTITVLEGPDLSSRTPDSDGRRIERLDAHRDWGWMILNYDSFRKLASEDERREKTLTRVRKHRDKYRKNTIETTSVTQCNAPVTQCYASNDMQRQRQRQRQKQVPAEREQHLPEGNGRMSLEEVKAVAGIIGLAEWKAVDWFQEMEGCGWLDHNRRPIQNGRAVLARVKTKWESDGRPTGPPRKTSAKRQPLRGTNI